MGFGTQLFPEKCNLIRCCNSSTLAYIINEYTVATIINLLEELMLSRDLETD